MDLKAHLEALCRIAAPSGHEAPIREFLRDAWADLVDDFRVDNMGNLIATRYGISAEPRRQIMLCAHMDEIGLIVAEIDNGFIGVSALGGVDFRVMLNQPVLVHGQRTLKGVFGAAPPHMGGARNKYPERDELWIDVGLPADEVAALVRIGDIITFDAPPLALKQQRLASKSLDNRASVAAVTVCLDALARRDHDWNVVVVASTQEETPGKGAATAAFNIMPDLAIVIDGTFGAQRGANSDDTFDMGGGPTIGRGPALHPLLEQALAKTARAEEIKTQVELLPRTTGTDADVIQVSQQGIPTALLSIPVRSMHTPVEVVDMRDIRRTGRLMATFIAALDPNFMDDIAWPEAYL